ncbi:MAG: METTL5 family protein, partial [Candidatus Aenigmatarchaeota archaeon]
MKTELKKKLSRVEGFSQPRVELEQYVTPPELAADLIHTAYMQGDVEGKEVVDLGTGTGILAIGAALAGAQVTAVEKDSDAIEIARENAE